MATLTASSTMQDIVNEFKNTCSFEESGSVALAKRFITAANLLLAFRGERMRNAQQTLQFNQDTVAAMVVVARNLIAAKSSTVRFASFRRFRT